MSDEIRVATGGNFTSIDGEGLQCYEGITPNGTKIVIERLPDEADDGFIRRVMTTMGWKVA